MILPAVLAAVALLALGLVACGGDSTSTGASTSTATTTGGSAGRGGDGSGGQGSQDSQQSGHGNTSQGNGSGSEANTVPLRVSGGGSAQFRTNGGDNSIQEFGSESDEPELRQGAETVHAFYVARAGEEWASACSYLAASQVKSLEQLAASSPQLQGKGCAPILNAVTKPLSPAQQRETTTVDAASLRQQGEQAFLLYTGPPGRTVYAMPLRSEAGSWKLGALSAAALSG